MLKSLTGVDHAVIAVRDLDAARDTFTRLGFTVTPRGHHNLGSQNHCVMFGRDYLELLALPVVHPANRHYAAFLTAGEGLAAAALATRSADRTYTEWVWAGLSPSPVVELARPVKARDGTHDARFRITQLPGATPGLHLFACQHLTPERVWRGEWQTHANGASGIAAIGVVCADGGAAPTARAYAKALGTAPRTVPEASLFDLGTSAIALTNARSLEARWPALGITARARPAGAVLFLRADRAAAEAALRRGGFAPRRMPDGAVAVDAEQAHGVALLFG